MIAGNLKKVTSNLGAGQISDLDACREMTWQIRKMHLEEDQTL
jgi:hypothetical protein